MRIRTGDVTAPLERSLLDDYFAFRNASFPPADGDYAVRYPVASDFEQGNGVFLVVEDGGAGDGGWDGGVEDGGGEVRAVGCGGIRMLPTTSPGVVRFEVKHVWLGEEARGQGWATALMEELEARAIALGATELVLDTHHGLEGAARLYARLGFDPVEPYNDNPNATRWYRKEL